ncbi:heavy-metal-associated domain-containing protein [Roseinatronobacter sp. S2]|uniref:heavy-metal-associated domain-containing protein n=1 Tax=Roseinatronobacter sp. S2 TaxID=3035471 RepID=UPI00240F5569|nr:cation transporter [Roseinatronobacter sp. S2]WFE77283.1 cation transporter [Roseinatronobacter sp. S2]
MKKLFVLALLAVSGAPAITAIPASAQSVAAEQSVTFAVDNMTCALCPVTVKRAMERVEGVRDVEIDFAARTATVLFDAATTNAEAIAQASANAGYPAVTGG